MHVCVWEEAVDMGVDVWVWLQMHSHTLDFGCVYGVVCTLVCTVMMPSDVRGLALDHITTPRVCAGACGCEVCEVH
jgi:hypothetical protein